MAYHAYQSFKSEEVTPERCHRLGVELAKRMWDEEYQVLETTHFNTGTYHNHFVVNSIGLCHWQQKRGHNQDGGIDIHKGSHEQEDDIDHQKKTNAAADIFGNQVGEKVGNARQSHYFACDSREGVQQTDHGSGGAGNGTAAPEGNLDFLFIDNLQNKEI